MASIDFMENRRHIRFDVEATVDFLVQDRGGAVSSGKKSSGIATNVSTGGVSFISDTRLEPGSTLKLDLHLPGHVQPLQLTGELRWCTPYGQQDDRQMFQTGVKLFTEVKSGEGRLIEYLCNTMEQCLRSCACPRSYENGEAGDMSQWVLVWEASRRLESTPQEIRRLIHLGLEARINPGSEPLPVDDPLISVDIPPVYVNISELERELGRPPE